jgi:hypothetical protein
MVAGFPVDHVDRNTVVNNAGYRGTIRVGETVTLYLVKNFGYGASPVDTLRQGMTWALSDSNAVHITALANGDGRITAVAPGTMGQVVVSGGHYDIFDCGGPSGICSRVVEIDVVP